MLLFHPFWSDFIEVALLFFVVIPVFYIFQWIWNDLTLSKNWKSICFIPRFHWTFFPIFIHSTEITEYKLILSTLKAPIKFIFFHSKSSNFILNHFSLYSNRLDMLTVATVSLLRSRFLNGPPTVTYNYSSVSESSVAQLFMDLLFCNM